MTEAQLSELFATMALVTSVKVFRDRGSGYSGQGYAFVELASHNAAAGVLEALKGEPIVATDGRKLRVNWASERQSDNHSGGYEAWAAYEGKSDGARDMRADGRVDAQRNERRPDRDGRRSDKGDGRGKGADGREAYHDKGKGEGRKGGKGGRGGDEAEGPSERGRHGTDARSDGRGGWSEAGKDSRRGGDAATWAYMDPHGAVQVGFSTDDMRQWFENGYFKEDLRVALVQEGSNGRKPKAPHPREFYSLKQWFRNDIKNAFTYVPKF